MPNALATDPSESWSCVNRILVLWASESSPNLGVSALARGSASILSAAWPAAELTFVNYGDRPAELPFASVRSLVKERVTGRLGMQDWLATFDLAWDTRSGDSFTDIYGTGRHRTMSAVHELVTRAGVPIIMAPQTIGPFDTLRGRLLARRTLRRSTAVFARDPESASCAHDLGRPVDKTVSDLVFAIDPPAPGRPRDVVLNVSGLLWGENPHVDATLYRSLVHDLVGRLLQAERHVSLLAHVRGSGTHDDDVTAVRAAAAPWGDAIEVIVPAGLDEARQCLGSAALVIGSRMHACLNALSLGVPAVSWGYSRKFEPLLRGLEWEHTIDLRTAGDPLGATLALALQDDLTETALRTQELGRAAAHGLIEELRAVHEHTGKF